MTPPAVEWQYRPPALPARSRPWLHLLLFLLTLLSMVTAGALQQGVAPLAGLRALVHLVEGIPFAATLLAVHEFGHYFAARRWQVRASLPYFLPLPYLSFLGTLGAVIRIRSAIPSRRALLDIGAAGPLAGLVVALVACVVGLLQSPVVAADQFAEPPLHLGAPLLFAGLAALALPGVGPEQTVLLDPIAFAGWVGLFITAFNLFPVGQLDGGHLVYALFGRRHRLVARAFLVLILCLGLYGLSSVFWGWPRGWPEGWPGWLPLAGFLSLFNRDHPPPVDDHEPLDPRRRLVGYLCLAVFVGCFAPVPFGTVVF
ncbi:MAG: site-2 protease family protein [Candidatus Latescibacterota bacterium]|jgi:membrane-associated protease RseP (regulator of RpoE activity)